MFNFLEEIANAIWSGVKGLWNMCKRIIKAVLHFVDDLLSGLFEILEDLFGDDIPASIEKSPAKPFIADMGKLVEHAPIKDWGLFNEKKKNFMKAVYDTKTGKIIRPTYVAGDKVDQETIDAMGNEPIIVIS